MKKNVFKWVCIPVITLVFGLVSSCQQTDESFLQEQSVGNENKSQIEQTRSALISATPSILSFASPVGTPVEAQTTLRLLGTGLVAVTSLDIQFVGEGASQFSVETFDPTLEDFIRGVPIKVTYTPTAAGSTTARMLIMASVMNLIDLNTTVDLYGMTFSSNPALGSTVTPTITLQTNGDQGEFTTILTFSENVTLDYRGFSNVEGSGRDNFIVQFDLARSSGNTAYLEATTFLSNPVGSTNFRAIVPEGFVTDAEGNPVQPFEVNYTVVYPN